MSLSTPGTLFGTVLCWRRDPPPISWTDKREEKDIKEGGRLEMSAQKTQDQRMVAVAACVTSHVKKQRSIKGLEAIRCSLCSNTNNQKKTPLCPMLLGFRVPSRPWRCICLFLISFFFLFLFLRALSSVMWKYSSLTTQTLCRGVRPVRRHVDLGLIQPIEWPETLSGPEGHSREKTGSSQRTTHWARDHLL